MFSRPSSFSEFVEVHDARKYRSSLIGSVKLRYEKRLDQGS